jgi:flagellar basal body-associated protein FliL
VLVANLYLVIVIVIVLAVIAFAVVWIRRSARAAQRDGEAGNARRRRRDADRP